MKNNNTVTFHIFDNRQISIPIEIANVYTENIEKLDNRTAEYLIKSSGCSSTNSDSELRNALIYGINDEVSAYESAVPILQKYLEENYVWKSCP